MKSFFDDQYWDLRNVYALYHVQKSAGLSDHLKIQQMHQSELAEQYMCSWFDFGLIFVAWGTFYTCMINILF